MEQLLYMEEAEMDNLPLCAFGVHVLPRKFTTRHPISSVVVADEHKTIPRQVQLRTKHNV